MPANRRDFLRSSLAASTLVSMGASTVPGFLDRSARAATDSKSNDRVLVVVQLIGGNDGLNTVVPHGLDGYAKGRRALRLPSGQIHKLSDEIGLHPSMGEMARLVEAGKASVVQGVGYPNPDRSHFRSMEIWETARLEYGALETGWLGRRPRRQARRGRRRPPGPPRRRRGPCRWRSSRRRPRSPRSTTLEQYRLQLGGDVAAKREVRDALERVARLDRPSADPLLGFVRRSTLAAYDSSKRLEQLDKAEGAKSTYPNFGLARRLELIARIIKAGLRDADLLHVARRLRHPRQPARRRTPRC